MSELNLVPVPTVNTAPQFGGFWIRSVAMLVDGFALLVPNLIIEVGINLMFTPSLVASHGPESGRLIGAFVVMGFQMGIGFLYFCVLQAKLEGTFGKKVFGLRVVRTDFGRVSVAQMIGRWLMTIPSFMIFCFGYFAVGVSRTKQGWHDKVAGTYVMKKHSLDQIRGQVQRPQPAGSAAA